MQRLEVSGAVRPLYGSLGVKVVNIQNVEPILGTRVKSISFTPPTPPQHFTAPIFTKFINAMSESFLPNFMQIGQETRKIRE